MTLDQIWLLQSPSWCDRCGRQAVACAIVVLAYGMIAVTAESAPPDAASPHVGTVAANPDSDQPQPLFGTSAPFAETNLKRLKEKRLEDIRRQIEELSKRQQSSPTTAESTAQPAGTTSDGIPAHAEHAPAVKGHATDPDHAGEQPSATEQSVLQPNADVVQGTIDRFALANSLFGTGDIKLCLEILEQMDVSKLSHPDRLWADYVKACCHRRAGRIDEAQKIYRRILADDKADWIGELARWWLHNIDEKVRLTAESKRLTDDMAAWEKDVDALIKSAP